MRETLEGMLKVLEEKDWIQGHLYRTYDGNTNYPANRAVITGACLEGACALTMPEDTFFIVIPSRLRDLLLSVMTDLFPERMDEVSALFEFNDHPQTTLEDIRLVIKTGIDRCDP